MTRLEADQEDHIQEEQIKCVGSTESLAGPWARDEVANWSVVILVNVLVFRWVDGMFLHPMWQVANSCAMLLVRSHVPATTWLHTNAQHHVHGTSTNHNVQNFSRALTRDCQTCAMIFPEHTMNLQCLIFWGQVIGIAYYCNLFCDTVLESRPMHLSYWGFPLAVVSSLRESGGHVVCFMLDQRMLH